MGYSDRKNSLINAAYQAAMNNLPALEGQRMALEQFGNPMGGVAPVPGVVPKFGAQIDINVRTCIQKAGAVDVIANGFPVPIFGYNDYKGNYAKNIGGVDLPAGWTFQKLFIYPDPAFTIPNAKIGDLIIHFHMGGADLFIIINCSNVAYGSLIDATGSDRFRMDLLRYSLPNIVDLSQFVQPIIPRKQSLFGRTTDDSLNPKSFKSKDQNQPDIIDIGYEFDITKQTSLNTFINVNSPAAEASQLKECFTWSIFVQVAETATSI